MSFTIHHFVTYRHQLTISFGPRYKMLIADLLIEMLLPIQSEITRLMTDKHHLSTVLNEGTRKATEIASDTWDTVSKKIGISVS